MFEPEDMFKAFKEHRGDAIVMTSGSSGGVWRAMSDNPKRDPLIGGAMSKTTSTALGIALAQPDQRMVLFDSEGALLMNLGAITTIAGVAPKNFYHFLMDNECYGTTGGQPVPNAENISYAEMARGAGYAAVYEFDDLEGFTNSVEEILSQPGPVFVAMKMVPHVQNEPIGRRVRAVRPEVGDVIRDLRQDLGIAAN